MILKTNPTGILFANFAGSADAGGHTMNEWLAAQRLSQAVSLINETIFSHRGVVTKKFEDGLLATFPDADCALAAALDIKQLLGAGVEETQQVANWRLALHFGQLHVVGGSVAGDVLDQVVQIALSAPVGSVYLSARVYEALTDSALRARAGLEAVPGSTGVWALADNGGTGQDLEATPAPRDEPDVPAQPPGTPEVAQPAAAPTAEQEAPTEALQVAERQSDPAPAPGTVDDPATAAGLRLQVGQESYLLDAAHGRITCGRSADNDIVLQGSHVSRRHGYFEWDTAGPRYVDDSANGSCLISDQETESTLHHAAAVLAGSGAVGLGPTRATSPELLIHYSPVT